VVFGIVRMADRDGMGQKHGDKTREETSVWCNERQVLLVESWTKMRGSSGNESVTGGGPGCCPEKLT